MSELLTSRTFRGAGELGERIESHDWSGTLARIEDWPQSLKTAVQIMLTSRQPIWIGWGPHLTYLYNDPYKTIIGDKHPWALGRPTKDFRDIADQVRAEETRQLLLLELNHRVKNTLASVQAIAHQTLRNTRDPSEFAARFSGRVQSMARVHALPPNLLGRARICASSSATSCYRDPSTSRA